MALVALCGSLVAGSAGCRPRDGAQRRTPFATQIAYGRPDACPEDAVDPYGDGTPSPMELRCSYEDGTGSIPTRIRGRVSVEGPAGTIGSSPGRIEVFVHEAPKALDGPVGRRVAHASTDPQGVFTVSAMLRSGEYVLVVRATDGGRALVEQRITLGNQGGHRLDDIQLVIPRPLDEIEPQSDPTPPAEPDPPASTSTP